MLLALCLYICFWNFYSCPTVISLVVEVSGFLILIVASYCVLSDKLPIWVSLFRANFIESNLIELRILKINGFFRFEPQMPCQCSVVMRLTSDVLDLVVDNFIFSRIKTDISFFAFNPIRNRSIGGVGWDQSRP